MAILAVVAGLIVGAAALQIGTEAGHALWLPVVLAALAALLAVLVLWHRRRMGEIHELYAVEIGAWRRVNHYAPWPKACRHCGQPAHDWKSTRAHSDPETSPCARLLAARDAAELAPAEHYAAEITGAGGRGDGAVDTMLPGEGRSELEGAGADG